MKKVRVQEAVGLKLCHDITKVVPGEFKGRAFQRDHVIQPEDVEELLRIGKEHIFVWEENAGEIHEDEAAVRIAEAVKGNNIVYDPPYEGKTTLRAKIKGVFKVNRLVLQKLNRIESITVACLPSNFTVEAGERLAGARIIPLVIAEEKILKLEEFCKDPVKVFDVIPYQKLKVGIIITGNEVYKGRIQDKFGPVINQKLKYYGAEILDQTYCPDDMDTLQQTIASFVERGADLIVMTGGMSVDPDDLTPGAIRNSGADVVTYGAPVQPGNMFMLANKEQTVLMGVPGAAIYHQTTIFDVVLPRIFIGERITKEDFVQMGEGGLCLGCEICRYPKCYFGRSGMRC